jgi:hypothetical protein
MDELLKPAPAWRGGGRRWGSRPRCPTPNRSPWRSAKPCSASPPRLAGLSWRLHQAPAPGGRAHRPCHRGHRHRHRAGERRRVDRGRHPGGGWPLQPDAQGFGAGRVGLLRPGCQPCTPVLGLRLHLVCTRHGPAGRRRAGRRQGRRPRGAAGPAGRPATPGRRPARGGCWWPTSTTTAARSRASRPSRACGCCDRRARANPTAWRAAVQAAAAADRVGQPHPQGQLDLERHGGHTPGGVWGRVLPRTLA